MEKQACIQGLGEALIDILPSGEVVGGAPLNFSIRVADLTRHLEYRTELLSRVGSDERGQKILKLLADRNVNVDLIQKDEVHPTGYVEIGLQEVEADYQFGTNVAWDYLRPEPSLKPPQLVCFGTLAQRSEQSRLAIEQILASYPEAVRLLDLNLREPLPETEVVLASLRMAHVLKCNHHELLWLGSLEGVREDEDAIAARLIQKFELDFLFCTRGAKGCFYYSGDKVYNDEGMMDDFVAKLPKTESADSVGAGDAAGAACAVGILEKWSPERIVQVANRYGAFAAHTRGPTATLPEEILLAILE